MIQTKMKPRAVGTAGASIEDQTSTQRLSNKPKPADPQDFFHWALNYEAAAIAREHACSEATARAIVLHLLRGRAA